jgi:uncharacterized membrane protein
MNLAGGLARHRWPAIALVASLVLNGFLAGVILTDMLRPHRSWNGERAIGFELRRMRDRLPRAAVEEVASELQPLGQGLEPRMERLRAIREEINRMAAEPSPDRAAINAGLAELRAETAAMQEEVQRATFDALLKLPAETRASLAGKPSPG